MRKYTSRLLSLIAVLIIIQAYKISSGSSSKVGEGIVLDKMSSGSSSEVGEGIVASKTSIKSSSEVGEGIVENKMSNGSLSEVGEGIVETKMSNGSSSEVGIVADKMSSESSSTEMPSGSSSIVGEEIVSSPTQPKVKDPSVLSLMKLMRERVGKLSYTKNEWSIYIVPSRLRELNKDAYTPRIVSIGPIHSGQDNLQDMEVHKTRYMESLFSRTTKNYDLILSEFAEAILSMEGRAGSCYYDCPTQQVSNSNNNRSLAEILLVDGCFLLELFLRWKYPGISAGKIDPLFNAGTIRSFRRDLALLENQIPFFVLERLYGLIRSPQHLSLTKLCASFFNTKLNFLQPNHGGKHLLDLIRNCYLPRTVWSSLYPPFNYYSRWKVPQDPRIRERCKQNYILIHCVTKLRESGIKFVKSSSKNLFGIKFTKGVLEIPKLRIDDTMDSLLRNMIAFEQCDHLTSYHITSYAVLMDYLIDSPADVEFLQHMRIIENYLGHGEEVSNIFNKISKKVFVEDFFFANLCNQVNEYCNLCWPKRRESFVRDYCLSPWKFIGLVAGSILLLFAGLQTGYTMASYHHPPK